MNNTEPTASVHVRKFPTTSTIQQRDLVRVLVAERVKMLAYIDSLVRDESLSEDLFQEVCMLAVEKAGSIKDETHLVKWLRTTARFHALNAMQKRLHNICLANEVLDSLESKWQSQYDTDNTSDRAEALRHCVDKMPAKSRDLIQRRYVQEMSYEQLAKALGRPIDSLYVTFSRIFATLGNCILDHLRTTGGNTRG
jgi:RNA polymerase sigma-70 factor (ECF subfamily)